MKPVYCVMNLSLYEIPMEISVIKESLVYGAKNGGNRTKNYLKNL